MADTDLHPSVGPHNASALHRTDNEHVQGQIGLRLRAVYEAMLSEPVPDRFKALLESLDCSSQRKT